ncbi:MAG: diaminopimelate epimerase [Christensenellales bacterium]
MEFIKMHGLGNDFVVIDCFSQPAPDAPDALARKVCRRRVSIGADGLVLILPAEGADARMRIFNADGTEPEMCGNAIRCVAKWLYESGRAPRTQMAVLTRAGRMEMRLFVQAGDVQAVRVDMGAPEITGASVFQLDGNRAEFQHISVGNPHAVTYAVEPSEEEFQRWGARVSADDAFPSGVNVEFCRVIGKDHIRVRVWERGAGATLACGTGATAAFFAGVKAGLVGERARVTLPGGDLEFEISADGRAFMTGPAEIAFRGTY